MESSEPQKACMRLCCKIRALWSGRDCSKPNSQGSICPPIDTMSEVDAILSHDIHVRSWLLLQDGRWPTRSLKGVNGRPTVRSIRLIRTKRVIPYQARASWEQSDRSSRVSHATPGNLGKTVYRAKDHRRQVENRARRKAASCISPFVFLTCLSL